MPGQAMQNDAGAASSTWLRVDAGNGVAYVPLVDVRTTTADGSAATDIRSCPGS